MLLVGPARDHLVDIVGFIGDVTVASDARVPVAQAISMSGHMVRATSGSVIHSDSYVELPVTVPSITVRKRTGPSFKAKRRRPDCTWRAEGSVWPPIRPDIATTCGFSVPIVRRRLAMATLGSPAVKMSPRPGTEWSLRGSIAGPVSEESTPQFSVSSTRCVTPRSGWDVRPDQVEGLDGLPIGPWWILPGGSSWLALLARPWRPGDEPGLSELGHLPGCDRPIHQLTDALGKGLVGSGDMGHLSVVYAPGIAHE